METLASWEPAIFQLNHLKSETCDCVHNDMQVDKQLLRDYNFLHSVSMC